MSTGNTPTEWQSVYCGDSLVDQTEDNCHIVWFEQLESDIQTTTANTWATVQNRRGCVNVSVLERNVFGGTFYEGRL